MSISCSWSFLTSSLLATFSFARTSSWKTFSCSPNSLPFCLCPFCTLRLLTGLVLPSVIHWLTILAFRLKTALHPTFIDSQSLLHTMICNFTHISILHQGELSIIIIWEGTILEILICFLTRPFKTKSREDNSKNLLTYNIFLEMHLLYTLLSFIGKNDITHEFCLRQLCSIYLLL